MVKSKPFERWEFEEVELTFGIKRVDTLPLLSEWVSAEESPTVFEKESILRNHKSFKRKAGLWNEDELKFFFISKIINLVDFSIDGVYSTFTQRTIAAKVANIKNEILDLRGRVELLVALGEQKPRHPFFFLNEYKPLNKTTPSDPVGQLLIAMVAARSLNEDIKPLYGVYVIGQYWHFVILNQNEYAISSTFDAVEEDELFKIFSILKRCKKYIETEIGAH